MLNLGLLDPTRKDAVDEALRLATAKLGEKEVQGVKVFLIVADQFLAVMRQVYGQGDAACGARTRRILTGRFRCFWSTRDSGKVIGKFAV